MKARLHIVIVCPARPGSNHGNARTAARWQGLLRAGAEVRTVQHWPDALSERDEVMLALHARKSTPAIEAWHARHDARGLGVALTGTDLSPDIAHEPLALRSLQQATGLVVLQALAVQALPEAFRDKARVIFQSCVQRQTLHKTARHLRVVMVGHLRAEKNPRMLWRAVRAIAPDAGILVDHIGDALEPALASEAQATAAACPHYRWLQGLSHAATLQRIQRAHLLVHTSRSEQARGQTGWLQHWQAQCNARGPLRAGDRTHGPARLGAGLARLIPACRAHSALAPDSLTTLVHLTISLAW